RRVLARAARHLQHEPLRRQIRSQNLPYRIAIARRRWRVLACIAIHQLAPLRRAPPQQDSAFTCLYVVLARMTEIGAASVLFGHVGGVRRSFNRATSQPDIVSSVYE